MKRRLTQVRNAARFAVGLSRGLRMGDFFPPSGRLPPGTAPGGSEEPARPAAPLTRAREEVGWFSVSEHRVPVPGLRRRIEVLHLTDVHLRVPDPWLDALADSLAQLRPDLIALTGDIVTRGWKREAVDRFLSALPDAPLGTFAVMGNWEYWAGAPPHHWAPVLTDHDIRLLVDEWMEVDGLVVAGTDDKLAGQPDVRAALGDRPTRTPTLVLTHSPALFPKLVAPDVAVVLAGHSHAGQVRLPLLGATWVPRGTGEFVGGWYRDGESHLFVSRGVGWSIAPVRFQCRPELARIVLEPA